MSADLFSTTDPLGRTVRLTERCYHDHIVVEHPDLDDPEEIERSVRLAEQIAQDTIDPQRTVYYRTYQRRPQRWLVKVVVDEQGEVVTAYRVKRMKQEEIILWQQ
ncbi:MAG: hypothetical protein DCC55_40415 [Chloroflexi bacterium]|nr:MAG: hypothetical protein DCC55_40415 [Chloroflexota bacterium]